MVELGKAMCELLGYDGRHMEPTWLRGWNDKGNEEGQGPMRRVNEDKRTGVSEAKKYGGTERGSWSGRKVVGIVFVQMGISTKIYFLQFDLISPWNVCTVYIIFSLQPAAWDFKNAKKCVVSYFLLERALRKQRSAASDGKLLLQVRKEVMHGRHRIVW